MKNNFDLKKYLAEGRLLKESAGYVYASCDRETLSVWTQESFDEYVEDIAEGDGTSKEEALEYLKDELMLTKLPNSPYLLVYANDERVDFISANTKEEFANKVNDEYHGELGGDVDTIFAEICEIADDSYIDGDSADQQIVIENGKIVGGVGNPNKSKSSNSSSTSDSDDPTMADRYHEDSMERYGKPWDELDYKQRWIVMSNHIPQDISTYTKRSI